MVPVALKIVHEMMGGDHCGVERTYFQARKRYFWKNMHRDIDDFVKNCTVCNSIKPASSTSTKVASYPIPLKTV